MPQTLVEVICEYCGTIFQRRISDYNISHKLGRKQYCSRSCARKANPSKPKRVETRFWAKVKKTDTCWVWVAGKNSGRYGSFYYEGKYAKPHRVSYILHYGEFPNELEVLHKCDNPRCVRPDHLFLGTQLDNVRDMDAKGRRRSSAMIGEENPSAKLKLSDVVVIRERSASGEKLGVIAKDYGIARTTVSDIKHRRRWRL